MRKASQDTQYWNTWGLQSTDDQVRYDLKNYEKTENFDYQPNHRFTYQDEKGRELIVTFEEYTTVLAETPVIGLNMLAIVRADTYEVAEVEDNLYRRFHEEALVKISETSTAISENLPSW